MAHLSLITTEVLFNSQEATRTSLLVTTLTDNIEDIKREAIRKAKTCYGLDIQNIQIGDQLRKK
jgi:hypothetical protein